MKAAVEFQGLPYDAARRALYSVPLVVSVAQAQGVCTTLAAGAVGLNVDQRGVSVQWREASNAEDFSRNLVRARCEGRYATSVFAPLGVVESYFSES